MGQTLIREDETVHTSRYYLVDLPDAEPGTDEMQDFMVDINVNYEPIFEYESGGDTSQEVVATVEQILANPDAYAVELLDAIPGWQALDVDQCDKVGLDPTGIYDEAPHGVWRVKDLTPEQRAILGL